jgi:hypothetical protein
MSCLSQLAHPVSTVVSATPAPTTAAQTDDAGAPSEFPIDVHVDGDGAPAGVATLWPALVQHDDIIPGLDGHGTQAGHRSLLVAASEESMYLQGETQSELQ